MAYSYVKNSNGEFYRNELGFQKDQAYSDLPWPDGLLFLGAADSNYLTQVDGLISESYDIRGTGTKMNQNTVSYRPYLDTSLGYPTIRFDGDYKRLEIAGQSVRSAFIVLKLVALSRIVLGYPSGNAYIGANVNSGYTYSMGSYYKNLTLSSGNSSYGTTTCILHTVTDFAISNKTISLGHTTSQNNINQHVLEWGFYSKLLNTQQTVYNLKYAIQKYNLTV